MGYPPPPVVAAPPVRKNPLLGRFSLSLAVLMAIVSSASVVPLATLHAQLIVSTGSTEIDSTLLAEIWTGSATAPLATWVGSILGSLAAMVLGLIAAISGRGRATGILAIVAGILTPVVWISCWLVVVAPAMTAVG
ncbi:MAG: hypothetical protein CVT62_11970 [Actinobacteria bacterium HGW-Actinobacteria-2]|nr:MAG: hypothetical protein CVT62_11970 [Actinobacteria bacterium HGW-Actinobacteria-2]